MLDSPFQRLNVLLGRLPEGAEVQNLRQAEWAGGMPMPSGAALFAGFYLNELLMRLLPRHDPLHPTAFPIVWTDVTARVSQIMPSGPVMPWLLMPAVYFGGAEWLAHAVQLALLLVAIATTVTLGLRLGLREKAAQAAGLLLATTPAVLGMAATAMPDVAAMAFGALGMERWLAFQSDRRWWQAGMAVVLLTLASLARSHLLLLVGVCGLFLYVRTRGRFVERLGQLFPDALPVLPYQLNRNVNDFVALYKNHFPFVLPKELPRGRITRAILVDTRTTNFPRGMQEDTPRLFIDHHAARPGEENTHIPNEQTQWWSEPVLGSLREIPLFFGAMTLGIANKFLEPVAGAVLGKIAILVLIILFIQKRPRGLFALKGRAVEA